MHIPLTENQKKLLRFIAGFISENDYPPKVEEMQEGVGYSNPGSVFSTLEGLETKEYITKKKHVARGVRLTENGKEYLPENNSSKN